MASPDFRALPIDPTEGFPQAFRLSLGGRTYQFRLSASVSEDVLAAAGDRLDLPAAQAYLVLAVEREEQAGLVPIFRRKLVPGVQYRAGELVLTFPTMVLDPRNLNGVGAFGSRVIGGVALR